jgi:hypothetical protein
MARRETVTNATIDAPAGDRVVERLGREVVIDQAQDQLDAHCAYLEKLGGERKDRLGKGLTDQEVLDHRFGVAVAACGRHVWTGALLYTVDDFRAWWRRAAEMGVRPSAIDGNVVGRLFRAEIVPNAKLRERAERILIGSSHANAGGLVTLDTIADAAGVCDATYASRLLGITPQSDSYLKWYLGYDQAAAIARVVGVPFQELGL